MWNYFLAHFLQWHKAGCSLSAASGPAYPSPCWRFRVNWNDKEGNPLLFPILWLTPTTLPPPGKALLYGSGIFPVDWQPWVCGENASKSPYPQTWMSLLCSYCLGLRGSWWTHTCRWLSFRPTRWDTDSRPPWGCTCCSWTLSLLRSFLQWHRQFFCCHREAESVKKSY